MTLLSRRLFLATPLATLFAQAGAASPAPAPLFRDPIYDGASDPVVIWNRQEKNWWLLYTQRRANVDGPGVAWVHGCDIGVARSTDDGHSWRYLGILPGLEYERGRNTFWAPEIVWHEGVYHMYASYVPGVPRDWSGARRMVHYSEPGKRPDDGVKGGHADVLVQGEDAWVFYFTHPGRVPGVPPPPREVRDVEPYAPRRTSVQVAKLELEGTEIVCRRDEPFPFRLQPGVDNWTR